MSTGNFAALPASFGRYRVEKVLGKGGMGFVYLARDTALDRWVALKIPKIPPSGAARLLQRFKQEAQALAQVDHPQVCKIYDYGEIQNRVYMALQFIDGEELKDLMESVDQILPEEAIGLTISLARALRAIHDNGLIHRDLKPANVMVNRVGDLVIADFGLARRLTNMTTPGLTQGLVIGTPYYMAPEQAGSQSQGIDQRCDIYALGVMLYEFLTGTWPFSGAAIEIIGQKSVCEPPSPLTVNPQLPPDLVAICLKMIARKPEDRYASCAEVIAALESVGQPSNNQHPAAQVFEFLKGVDPLAKRRPGSSSGSQRLGPLTSGFGLEAWKSRAGRWTAALARNKTATISSLLGICLVALWPSSFLFPTTKAPDQLASKATPATDPMHGTTAGESRSFTMHDIGFQWCPPGTFLMGTPGAVRREETPVEVTHTRGFWMGRTEVTQAQWEAVVGSRPWAGQSLVRNDSNFPALYVSHGDQGNGQPPQADSATWFCMKLTETERAAGRLPAGWSYRLPTEAEWEYACRAGTTTVYSFSDNPDLMDDYGWWCELFHADKPGNFVPAHEVGLKRANPWGLQDMHGNAWEWCRDWNGPALLAGNDPGGYATGAHRSARGSGIPENAYGARSAARGMSFPSKRDAMIGFRIVLSATQPFVSKDWDDQIRTLTPQNGLLNPGFTDRMWGWETEGVAGQFYIDGSPRVVSTYGIDREQQMGSIRQTWRVPHNAVALTFKISGGNSYQRLFFRLKTQDTEHYRITARNSNTPFDVTWDLRRFRGQRATVELVDETTGPWGFIALHELQVIVDEALAKPLTIEDVFPLHSTYTGQFGSDPNHRATSSVTKIDNGVATLRYVNNYGRWDMTVDVVDGKVRVLSATGLDQGFSGRLLNGIENIDMTGPADEAARDGKLTVSGMWTVVDAMMGTRTRGDISIEFIRDPAP